jgi:hypothetical protein
MTVARDCIVSIVIARLSIFERAEPGVSHSVAGEPESAAEFW